jgi:hypothetical protein
LVHSAMLSEPRAYNSAVQQPACSKPRELMLTRFGAASDPPGAEASGSVLPPRNPLLRSQSAGGGRVAEQQLRLAGGAGGLLRRTPRARDSEMQCIYKMHCEMHCEMASII